jgi:ribosomal protein L29
MAKKKKEIRDMSRDQLIDHVEVLKKELFNLKIEIISGQNNNTSSISKIKKDIARAKTFITMQDKEVEIIKCLREF